MLKYFKEKINELKQHAKEEKLALEAFHLAEQKSVKAFKQIIHDEPNILLKVFKYNNYRPPLTILEFALEQNHTIIALAILNKLETLISENKREEFFNFSHNPKNCGALFMALQNEVIFTRLVEMGATLQLFDKLNEFCKNTNTLDLKGYLEFSLESTVKDKVQASTIPVKVSDKLRKNILMYPQLLEKTQLEKSLSNQTTDRLNKSRKTKVKI